MAREVNRLTRESKKTVEKVEGAVGRMQAGPFRECEAYEIVAKSGVFNTISYCFR